METHNFCEQPDSLKAFCEELADQWCLEKEENLEYHKVKKVYLKQGMLEKLWFSCEVCITKYNQCVFLHQHFPY